MTAGRRPQPPARCRPRAAAGLLGPSRSTPGGTKQQGSAGLRLGLLGTRWCRAGPLGVSSLLPEAGLKLRSVVRGLVQGSFGDALRGRAQSTSGQCAPVLSHPRNELSFYAGSVFATFQPHFATLTRAGPPLLGGVPQCSLPMLGKPSLSSHITCPAPQTCSPLGSLQFAASPTDCGAQVWV